MITRLFGPPRLVIRTLLAMFTVVAIVLTAVLLLIAIQGSGYVRGTVTERLATAQRMLFELEQRQSRELQAQVAVVISGTVTDRLAPAVAAIVDGCEQQAGRRPAVISFGACASSGGPYWDSYAVTKGVDQLVAVDAYVPGCPPPPEALSAVLDQTVGRLPS